MATESARVGIFEPIHAAHALEQVTLGIQFERSVTARAFAQISKEAEAFADFSERQELQGVSISIGAPVGGSSVANGLLFRKKHEDGSAGSAYDLIVDASSIVFRTTRYTRWKEVWTQAEKYFVKLTPLYKTPIASLQLNFVDKFRWQGEISESRPKIMLRPNSPYLPAHVFEQPDLWHSHTGVFLKMSSKIKRLLNVNVDHSEEKVKDVTKRQVVISTFLNDMLNQDGYEVEEISGEEAIPFFKERFGALHDFGKEVFGQTISDEMAKRIALKESS